MPRFWRAIRKAVHPPFITTIEQTVRSFSLTGRILFGFFAAVCILSAIALVFILNNSLLVAVPGFGSSLTEGVIGSPRFINPVLALSDADHDVTALVYSGLLHANPDGSYTPDLAQSYQVSSDGLTYTAVIKPNATFQDGTPVTADDVVFTIQKTQDIALKSPIHANWNGVTVTKIDTKTVQFTLRQPYAPFIDNLTLGILPKHVWGNVSDTDFPFSNLNVNPIGSGPFRIASIKRDANGVPSSYTLSAFGEYALGAPYLSNLALHFYQSEAGLEDALKTGAIESAGGLSPETLSSLNSGGVIMHPSLSRVYAVFFNQNKSSSLQDKTVRTALNDAINKDDLIKHTLNGYGKAISGPLPSDLATANEQDPATLEATAKQLLLSAGWKEASDGTLQKSVIVGKTTSTQTLAVSLTTGDTPELRAVAQYISDVWTKVGVKVTVKIFNQGDLTQNVIRPRAYEALLFGEVVGREPDLYAFWSSTERNDPGLNVAMYANPAADALLSQLRQTRDTAARQTLYQKFDEQLQKDIPAIFLYAPDFVYSVPNDLAGLDLGIVETPSDRFLSVRQWHREIDHVWPIFVPTHQASKI